MSDIEHGRHITFIRSENVIPLSKGAISCMMETSVGKGVNITVTPSEEKQGVAMMVYPIQIDRVNHDLDW